jgi:hypothetical protein
LQKNAMQLYEAPFPGRGPISYRKLKALDGHPGPIHDTKAETMRIASKVGIVLATVAMSVGVLGSPAEAAKDSSWGCAACMSSAKYIP